MCTPGIVFVEHRFEQNRRPGLPTAAANPSGFVSNPFGGGRGTQDSGRGRGHRVTGDITVFRFSTDGCPAHRRVWPGANCSVNTSCDWKSKRRNGTVSRQRHDPHVARSRDHDRVVRRREILAISHLPRFGRRVPDARCDRSAGSSGPPQASIGEGDGLLGLAAETIFADVPACRFTTLRIPMSAFPHSVVRSDAFSEPHPAEFGPCNS